MIYNLLDLSKEIKDIFMEGLDEDVIIKQLDDKRASFVAGFPESDFTKELKALMEKHDVFFYNEVESSWDYDDDYNSYNEYLCIKSGKDFIKEKEEEFIRAYRDSKIPMFKVNRLLPEGFNRDFNLEDVFKFKIVNYDLLRDRNWTMFHGGDGREYRCDLPGGDVLWVNVKTDKITYHPSITKMIPRDLLELDREYSSLGVISTVAAVDYISHLISSGFLAPDQSNEEHIFYIDNRLINKEYEELSIKTIFKGLSRDFDHIGSRNGCNIINSNSREFLSSLNGLNVTNLSMSSNLYKVDDFIVVSLLMYSNNDDSRESYLRESVKDYPCTKYGIKLNPANATEVIEFKNYSETLNFCNSPKQ